MLTKKWLVKCSRLITSSFPPNRINQNSESVPMNTIIWTTPLGLPVVQPYRRESMTRVSFFKPFPPFITY